MIVQVYSLDVVFPDEILVEVGRLTLRCTQLEHVLKLAIKRLLQKGYEQGMKEADDLYVIPQLCVRAKELYAAFRKDQVAEVRFEALMDRVELAARSRNRVVHSLWLKDASGSVQQIHKQEIFDIQIEELRAVIAEVETLIKAVNAATATLGFPGTVVIETEATAATAAAVSIRSTLAKQADSS